VDTVCLLINLSTGLRVIDFNIIHQYMNVVAVLLGCILYFNFNVAYNWTKN